MNLVEESASDEIMDKTYERLCYRRKHYWTITNHGTCNFAGRVSKGLISLAINFLARVMRLPLLRKR